MSDFEVKCCRAIYARKFKLIDPSEYANLRNICKFLGIIPKEIKEEFFKKNTCPVCGNFILEYTRIYKTGKVEKRFGKLKNDKAIKYLVNVEGNYKEIPDIKIETGSKSNLSYCYGKNNTIYNYNNKSRGSRVTNPINTIKGEFTPPKQILTA